MLIDYPSILKPDPILAAIGQLNGNKTEQQLATGIYQIAHFGSSHWPGEEFKNSWDIDGLSLNPYGICDDHQQILVQCPELQDPERQFVVTLTEVRKDQQPDWGGWRWHKWGPYIGTHDIQHEYLYDEQGIERVFVYHIYEKKA